jgi:hypothetical protein
MDETLIRAKLVYGCFIGDQRPTENHHLGYKLSVFT